MKFTITLAAFAALASAVPTPTTVTEVVKRWAITDTAYGYASQNGGTSGGLGGSTTTVSSFAQFTAAVAGDKKKVVFVSAPITQAAKAIKIGANTSIIGKNNKVKLTGFGLYIKDVKNVVVRNIAISKVLAKYGDALSIQKSTNVWIDHVDLSSDLSHDKDYYDGLLDVTHAADFVSITNCFLHDHWKASLVGHSDNNGAEDKGHLRVTYADNYFFNINSRGPSFRFGTGHIYNNYFLSVSDGINTRQGANVLVESNTWEDSKKALYSTDGGFAVSVDNNFGGGKFTAKAGSVKSVPYAYTKVGSKAAKAHVWGQAGNTLSL